MKVKCINNSCGNAALTIGKTYEVINEHAVCNAHYLYLINDNGRKEWFVRYWFKPLSEIRNETINKLLAQ